MKRTKSSLSTFQQVITDILSRSGLARRLGYSYGDKRKIYKALGYPEEKDLTFEYFFNKYDRQDIARAVIDRPCDATWKGDVAITEPDKNANDSDLNKKWKELDELHSIKKRLNKVDKLCELGRYSLLLLGLDDVKDEKQFKLPVSGARKLLYLKQVAESEADVHTWETKPNNPRYGLPVLYKIRIATAQAVGSNIAQTQEYKDIFVHYTRVIHYVTGNLTSEVIGVSKLKPIINRLVDLEKILGGDAEMFWRGARPGYTATAKEDYELSDTAESDLMGQLDNFEHDLRRFLVLKGMDVQALETQISDPLNHIDAQLQAISAQTGIPKRVLIGSERGELASTQDADQWKELVKTRQEEHAEPTILRQLIDTLMKYKILPMVENYNVMWDDVFAPSEKDKADVGKIRAEALKIYTDSALASEVLVPALALKHLLGLNEEQVQEALQEMEKQQTEEDRLFNRIAQQEEELAARQAERERETEMREVPAEENEEAV